MGTGNAQPSPQEGASAADCAAAGQVHRRLTDTPHRVGFPRRVRLTRGSDLLVVRQEGKRIRAELFEVRVAASLLPHPRVGIVVPKYKHSSVDRNRLKRRLRELARTRWLPWLPAGADVVLRAVPGAYEATFDRLAEQIVRTGERIQRIVMQRAGGTTAPGASPGSGTA